MPSNPFAEVQSTSLENSNRSVRVIESVRPGITENHTNPHGKMLTYSIMPTFPFQVGGKVYPAPIGEAAHHIYTADYGGDSASYTEMEFPELVQAMSVSIFTITNLIRIKLPKLKYIDQWNGAFFGFHSPNLVEVEMPELMSSGALYFNGTGTGNLKQIVLPKLQVAHYSFYAIDCAGLETIHLPECRAINRHAHINGNPNLSDVILGKVGEMKRCGIIYASGCALSQASVDHILELLVSMDGTNGKMLWGAFRSVDMSGGTSSPPSAAGLANKAILVSRGATVIHN